MRAALGRNFGWLWAAYAVSTYGTWLGFGAFSYLAIRVVHASAAQVSALSAAGLAVGAALALPLGPWVEFRRKRPVMIAMDVVRFLVLLSVPIAYWRHVLGFAQLVAVSIVVAAAKIAFDAASGAHLKALVPKAELVVAAGRFESTTWSASVIGPLLGGAAIGLLGPVVTVLADAVSYLLSALGITAIGGREPAPPRRERRLGAAELIEGWRHLLGHPTLRPLLLNAILVNSLIMAAEPVLSVLMLGPLGFPAWEYSLAFAVPCTAGLIGSRLARRVVARFGQPRTLRTFGVLRACWPIFLVLIRPGTAGLLVVMVTEFGLILCSSLFSPVLAAYRIEHTDGDRLTRVLAAWSVSTSVGRAVLTALWGVLAELTSPRIAIGVAGLLLLTTPLLLRRVAASPAPAHTTAGSAAASPPRP